MSVTDHTATGSSAAPRGLAGFTWWQAIGAATITATVVNLLIFALAWAGGASFEIIDQGTLHPVTATGVVTSSVVPLVLGTGLAALLGLWWRGFIRVGQIVGLALALLSVAGPLMSDTDVATQWALAAMHVVSGLGVIAALEPIYRRAR